MQLIKENSTYFWISYNHVCLSKQTQMTREAGRDNEGNRSGLRPGKPI